MLVCIKDNHDDPLCVQSSWACGLHYMIFLNTEQVHFLFHTFLLIQYTKKYRETVLQKKNNCMLTFKWQSQLEKIIMSLGQKRKEASNEHLGFFFLNGLFFGILPLF